MSSYTLLLLLAFHVKISVDSVMIVTKGTPEVYINYSSLAMKWDQCLTWCTQNDLCVAVHTIGDGNCQIFEFGDLQTVKRSNDIESKFAYKVKNENASTCPADDTIGETTTPYHLTKHLNPGIFNQRDHSCVPALDIKCSRGHWGLGVFSLPLTPTVRTIQQLNLFVPRRLLVLLVESIHLSGIDTPEKSDLPRIKCKESDSKKAFSFADPTLSANPTGYLFNTGKPNGTGADCLAFRVNSDRTCGIDNILCDQGRTSDNSTCLGGQVCGLPPA
ncbi:hypothetical protein CRE_24600 [Caenorhabditis remanei]|uniref:PAN-3 domain-containing protein n=1 Tax=Caenorhabditis remanei TaxID=31234 RepID=E3MVE1_CAERE|nr:hypothetical protein CRE_24600 [Caenorhabditis remanei]